MCNILVNSSGVYTNKFDSFPTLENATWEKHRADALDGKHVNNIIQNTTSSFQINALYPLVRNTHYILYSEMHIISTSQINTLYPLQRNTHYILFSEIHIIFSSQKCTLYPLLRNKHYILFSDKHNMSFSQIYTVYHLLR